MKITESQLRKIIAEEISSLSESIPEKAKTDAVAAALLKVGVPSTALNKVKGIFKDLKEKKLDVNKAKEQLDTTEKDALVASFLQMVVEDDMTNLGNLFNALKVVAKQQQ